MDRYLISFLTAAMLAGMFVSPVDARIFQVANGTTLTVSWDRPATGGAEGYEFYFLQLEDGKIYGRGTTTRNTISVRFRTPGHYALWVRSYVTVNGVKEWGAWADSTDPAFGMVSGARAPWVANVLKP